MPEKTTRSNKSPACGVLQKTLETANQRSDSLRASAPSVAVVGLGYVGLPTAVAFASVGTPVIGIDIDQGRLRDIKNLEVDISREDLQLLGQLTGDSMLEFCADPGRLSSADYVLVCVPTPVDEHDAPDLALLTAVRDQVVANARPGQTVILTSTVAVGTTRTLFVEALEAKGFVIGQDVHVAFCPERVDPGDAVFTTAQVPRVLAGVTPACTESAARLLRQIAPVVEVENIETAELTKLYENSFRAVNIALINEIEEFCFEMGLNVSAVIGAASTKPFGFMPFRPGPGVGGHCIPVDPHYLLKTIRESQGAAPVLEAAMAAVARRPALMVDRICQALKERGVSPQDSRLLIVGVAYKPNVSDTRGSPAIQIIDGMRKLGATVDFIDARVPTIVVGGALLHRATVERAGDLQAYDLSIIHTLHSSQASDWLSPELPFLDLTNTVTPRQPTLLSSIDGSLEPDRN